MDHITHFLNHLDDAIPGYVLALATAAFVRALPEPLPMGNRFYLFVYRFIQGLYSNFDLRSKTNGEAPKQ